MRKLSKSKKCSAGKDLHYGYKTSKTGDKGLNRSIPCEGLLGINDTWYKRRFGEITDFNEANNTGYMFILCFFSYNDSFLNICYSFAMTINNV